VDGDVPNHIQVTQALTEHHVVVVAVGVIGDPAEW
tara:strand:- start:2689 stop:2793 length:105 start_codon:yes stop_codon:yes gene_type:complete